MRGKFGLAVTITLVLGVFAAVAAAASSPSVSTGSHKKVTQTTAELLGTVNPNGSATSYFFQWGLTTGYGSVGHVHSVGSGTKTVNATGFPAGLISGTQYHYRLVAFNRYGFAIGRDRTFTTTGPPPPLANTGAATAVGTSGATLTGVVDPEGAATTWYIQYGLTPFYGMQTAGATVPAGKVPVVVSQALGGLASGTIFHYRLVAVHSNGFTGYGNDMIFMTEPSPAPKSRTAAKTTPHHAHHRPFIFTTTGRVIPPPSIPAQFGCNGSVAIRFFLGRRNVSFIVVPLQSDCTFSGVTVFHRKPGRGPRNRVVTLRVGIRFRGNGYLQTSSPAKEFVTVG